MAPPPPAPLAPAAPEPVVPQPVVPEPMTDAFGSMWLMVIWAVAAVTAIVAFIGIRARRRLQRVTVVEGTSEIAEGAVSIGKLQIRPNIVNPGEAVTIIAEAISAISVKSSYSLVLKIRNVVEAITEMSLSPRGSQKAAFTVIKDKPGLYDIDLEGLKGNFVVKGVPLSPPPAALAVALEPVAEVERYRRINVAISTVVMKAAFAFYTARERLVMIAASVAAVVRRLHLLLSPPPAALAVALEPVAEVERYRRINVAISTVVMKAAFAFYTARERLVVIAASVVMKAAFVFYTARERLVVIAASVVRWLHLLLGKLKSKKSR